jgi:hypothetical protein
MKLIGLLSFLAVASTSFALPQAGAELSAVGLEKRGSGFCECAARHVLICPANKKMTMLIQNRTPSPLHVKVDTVANLDEPGSKEVDIPANDSMNFKIRASADVLGRFILSWGQPSSSYIICTANNPLFGPNTYDCRGSLNKMSKKVTRQGGGSGSDAWITWIVENA